MNGIKAKGNRSQQNSDNIFIDYVCDTLKLKH